MILIPLTMGKTATIDDEDAEKVKGYKWCAMRRNRKNLFHVVAYVRGTGRRNRKGIYLHQVIMSPPKGYSVDHIDHNGLNNRRNNLRLATPSQQCMNQRIRTDNKSGFRGVIFLKGKRNKPWRTELKVLGKNVFQGHFHTAIEAAKAYNEASLKFHGEFGYRNLIPVE